ncbi:MAG: CbtB-domain containing protein [Thaumarchaeota archaeon]|nr:CbtB-domain containing protein [Nitrososphaerota archaeon]MDE1866692.1 CbtB-domain containing protein [Nitrososphaerota archaeon]
MVNTSQITKTRRVVPIIAAVALFALFGLGYFVVGFDQGQLFSIAEGQMAYGQMNGVGYLHEFTHDMRHASGFPCH